MKTRTRATARSRHSPWALVVACSLVLAALPARGADTDGFLYGEVVTTSDKTYVGILRWGTEEAFWDDLFNSAKTKAAFQKNGDEESAGRTIEVFGRKLTIRWGQNAYNRQFVARFGDIDRIEVRGSGKAHLVMRDGTELDVAGSANDVEATIEVRDATLGRLEIPWKKIQSIDFRATPNVVEAPGYRLAGKVSTTSGDFEGYIQWDKQECLSIDKLDGEEDDIELSLEFGKIRSIARHDRRSSEVVLRDGRELVLSGTNDVDDDNRGILVEDPRFGRVEVPWKAFEKLELREAGSSGRGYDEFGKYGELRGRVRADGQTYSGRIVFDLDEAYGWEMIDGYRDDIAYSIPLGMVARIEPRTSRTSTLRLRSGEEIVLGDTQDVSDDNDGVLVIPDDSDEGIHIEWEEIDWIELDG